MKNYQMMVISVVPFIVFPQMNYAREQVEAKPTYLAEAPLPKGWPIPGPYDQVSVKKYPACRVVVTEGTGSSLTFLRLFRHSALSYAWQGGRSTAHLKKAEKSLLVELQKRKLEYSALRLLGYNGPGVPNEKKTWELQAILK